MAASPRHAYAYWRPRLAMASAAGLLALGAIWMLDLWGQERAVTQQEEETTAGTVAVGDSVLTAPLASTHAPSEGTPITQAPPAEPLPRQIRPDARGRCPEADMVAIDGGCWMKIAKDPKACAKSEYSFAYQGACYVPAYRLKRPPATSSPPEMADSRRGQAYGL